MSEVTNGYAPTEERYPVMQVTDGRTDWKYQVYSDQPVAGLCMTARGDNLQQVLEDFAQLVQMANAMRLLDQAPPFQPTPANLGTPVPTSGPYGVPQQAMAPAPFAAQQPQAQAFHVVPAAQQPQAIAPAPAHTTGSGVAPTCDHVGPDGRPMARVWFESGKDPKYKGWACAMRGRVTREAECKMLWAN